MEASQRRSLFCWALRARKVDKATERDRAGMGGGGGVGRDTCRDTVEERAGVFQEPQNTSLGQGGMVRTFPGDLSQCFSSFLF